MRKTITFLKRIVPLLIVAAISLLYVVLAWGIGGEGITGGGGY